MRRRDFIAGMSGLLATWPLAVRAQPSAITVIGFLNGGSAQGLMPTSGTPLLKINPADA
jgi:hypothetical protein